MAIRERPHAVNGTEIFLSMVLDEFEALGKTLNAILDRLQPVTITVAGEPAGDAGPETVQISEPAAPKKRTPAKKTTGGKA